MKRSILLPAVALGAFCLAFCVAAETKAKSSSSKQKRVATKAPATKASTSKSKSPTSKTTAKKGANGQAKTVAKRPTQQVPTTERYKEIQQALADRGFFSGSVDGNWGPSSVEALKRFQRDQNIGDDGKLGALSIIALGLGPRRTQNIPNGTPAVP